MLIMLIILLLNLYHLVSHTRKRKGFSYDLWHYFWDDPNHHKEGVDGVIRRFVPEHEQEHILHKSHSESYEGHHIGDRTAHKVLQSGFYWPTLFKDACKFVLSCDNVKELVILVDVRKCL